MHLKRLLEAPSIVANAYKFSYIGEEDWEDFSWRLAQEKR
jgi:hypothetical protein